MGKVDLLIIHKVSTENIVIVIFMNSTSNLPKL